MWIKVQYTIIIENDDVSSNCAFVHWTLFNSKKGILRWNKYLLFYRIKLELWLKTKEFARQPWFRDKLNKYRDEFIFQKWTIKKVLYFNGNHHLVFKKELELMSMNGWFGQT
jgi:hypothetical protein